MRDSRRPPFVFLSHDGQVCLSDGQTGEAVWCRLTAGCSAEPVLMKTTVSEDFSRCSFVSARRRHLRYFLQAWQKNLEQTVSAAAVRRKNSQRWNSEQVLVFWLVWNVQNQHRSVPWRQETFLFFFTFEYSTIWRKQLCSQKAHYGTLKLATALKETKISRRLGRYAKNNYNSWKQNLFRMWKKQEK